MSDAVVPLGKLFKTAHKVAQKAKPSELEPTSLSSHSEATSKSHAHTLKSGQRRLARSCVMTERGGTQHYTYSNSFKQLVSRALPFHMPQHVGRMSMHGAPCRTLDELASDGQALCLHVPPDD
eukprot:4234297-Amphidinium_carterae.3